jgi:hypothetical protein
MKLFNAFALAAMALGPNLVSGERKLQGEATPVVLGKVVFDLKTSGASEAAADTVAEKAVSVGLEATAKEFEAEGGGTRRHLERTERTTQKLSSNSNNQDRRMQIDLTPYLGDPFALVIDVYFNNLWPECSSLVPADRKLRELQHVTVYSNCYFIDGASLFLSVGSVDELVACEAPLDGDVCKKYYISFWPYSIPADDLVIDVSEISEPEVKTVVTKVITDAVDDGEIEKDEETIFTFAKGVTVEVNGDPHFKTWSGAWFDFMGECDMKMIHAPHFDGEGRPLDVDVRTKIRHDYSYVESAAIKLGNDTLEVASYGDYFLNGIAGATMPAFVGGYPVTHSNPSKKIHIFEVAIADDEKIVIKTFKDLVAVAVNEVEPKRFTGALGMTGSFDKFGKMIGRDGQTEITDPTDFANEWQIRQDETSLFNVAKGPQHPEQCKLPTVSTSEKRRRLGEGLAREKAERACAHFSGEHFENCVFDIMAVGDIEIAQAGAY